MPPYDAETRVSALEAAAKAAAPAPTTPSAAAGRRQLQAPTSAQGAGRAAPVGAGRVGAAPVGAGRVAADPALAWLPIPAVRAPPLGMPLGTLGLSVPLGLSAGGGATWSRQAALPATGPIPTGSAAPAPVPVEEQTRCYRLVGPHAQFAAGGCAALSGLDLRGAFRCHSPRAPLSNATPACMLSPAPRSDCAPTDCVRALVQRDGAD